MRSWLRPTSNISGLQSNRAPIFLLPRNTHIEKDVLGINKVLTKFCSLSSLLHWGVNKLFTNVHGLASLIWWLLHFPTLSSSMLRSYCFSLRFVAELVLDVMIESSHYVQKSETVGMNFLYVQSLVRSSGGKSLLLIHLNPCCIESRFNFLFCAIFDFGVLIPFPCFISSLELVALHVQAPHVWRK